MNRFAPALLFVGIQLASMHALAAEVRAAPAPKLAPDAFCRVLAETPGVTQVQCDLATGRPLVVSGHSPTGELYRLEYLYGQRGAAERMRVNGGEPISLVPVPDAESVVERMKEAQGRANGQRMELCVSGEVVVAGSACAAPKEGVPVIGFCTPQECYGNSRILGNNNGWIRTTPGLIESMDAENGRALLMCMVRRETQLSACSEQYEAFSLTCAGMGYFGGAPAIIACEVGMVGMHRYCDSLAPNC
jgi:hypothetical protein